MASAYNNNEAIDGISSGDVHNVSCDSCRSMKIYSDRYKCLQCVDYNLCGNCFEERLQTKDHVSGHPMAHMKIPNELFGQPIRHSQEITMTKVQEILVGKKHNIQCDSCRTSIVGARFKCDTCHNYNLCSACVKQRVISKQHRNTHPLVVNGNESLIKIDISDIRKGDILGQGGFGPLIHLFVD